MRIRTSLVLFLVSLTACAARGGRERAHVRTTSAAAPAPRGTPESQTRPATGETSTLTSAEVLGYIAAVDEGQRELAVLAKQKATSNEVKDYADGLLTQYQDAQRRLQELGGQPDRSSEPAEHVGREATRAMTGLRDQDRREFDRIFMATQIRAHRDVLATIDQRLAPSATTDEMKGFVASVRLRVAGDLVKAEAIHGALTQKPTSHDENEKNPRR